MNLYPKILILSATLVCFISACHAVAQQGNPTEQSNTETTVLQYSSPQVPESVMFCV